MEIKPLFRLPTLIPATPHPLPPPISKLKLSCAHDSSQRGSKGISHHLHMVTFPVLHYLPSCSFLASSPVGSPKCGPVNVLFLPLHPSSTGMQTRFASTVRRTMRPLNIQSSTASLMLRNSPPVSQGSPTSALLPHYGSQLCSSKDSQTTS